MHTYSSVRLWLRFSSISSRNHDHGERKSSQQHHHIQRDKNERPRRCKYLQLQTSYSSFLHTGIQLPFYWRVWLCIVFELRKQKLLLLHERCYWNWDSWPAIRTLFCYNYILLLYYSLNVMANDQASLPLWRNCKTFKDLSLEIVWLTRVYYGFGWLVGLNGIRASVYEYSDCTILPQVTHKFISVAEWLRVSGIVRRHW